MSPEEYLHPKWNDGGCVHNWKTYIKDDLRAIWETFTDEQKLIIAENAALFADNEEWD
jgi:hypothetical protein